MRPKAIFSVRPDIVLENDMHSHIINLHVHVVVRWQVFGREAHERKNRTWIITGRRNPRHKLSSMYVGLQKFREHNIRHHSDYNEE
jgi:hypothetical protein